MIHMSTLGYVILLIFASIGGITIVVFIGVVGLYHHWHKPIKPIKRGENIWRD